MSATREVFFGITASQQDAFYTAAAVATLIFVLGTWNRISVWTDGRDDEKFSGFTVLDFLVFAAKGFFSKNCILARKSFALATYRGVMLLFIIWGFATLFLGTVLLTIHHYSTGFLFGDPYLVFSLSLDAAGLLLIIGLGIAIARRHLVPEVRRVTSAEDLLFLYLLLIIALSGFIVEGMRLSIQNPLDMDYSPVGAMFTFLVKNLGFKASDNFTSVWAIHAGSALMLIAYLPFSKLFHLFSAQVTVAAAEKRYGGAIGGN